MRQILLCCLLVVFFALPGEGGTGHGLEDYRSPEPRLLLEIKYDTMGQAKWLSQFDVRLAAPGLLLVEVPPERIGLLADCGLSHRILGTLDEAASLYCCSINSAVPKGFERVWSSREHDVQVLSGRPTEGLNPFEAHTAMPLPHYATPLSWFRAEPPEETVGRLPGRRARHVASEISSENIEMIIDDLTYDASAGTLLTRYTFRDETVERALSYIRDLLINNLGGNGTVELQEFPLVSRDDPPMAYNIIGTVEGSVEGAGYYILSGHYDSIAIRTENWDGMRDPAPGADDNASGVAVILECARALAAVPLDFDLKFIFFSGEEQGIMGSTYFVANMQDYQDDGPLLGVINADMVAYNPGGDTLEIVTDALSSWIADFIVESYDDLALEVGELAVSSVEKLRYPFSDDGAFQVRGYPAVTCIEKQNVEDSNPYYHTVEDHNVDDKLNITQATKTAKLIGGAMAALAARQDTPDLEVLPADLVFSAPPFPVVRRAEVGDTVTVSVRVRNVGGPVAVDGPPDGHLVNMKLYDGDPDFGAPLIAEDGMSLPMPAMGGHVFSPKWVLTEDLKGSHKVTAVVSLMGSQEEDLSNNRAQASFAVIGDRLNLLEHFVSPSPADPRSRAMMHYFLTQPAGVRIEVFDAAGRLVGSAARPRAGGRIPGVNFLEVNVDLTEIIEDYSDMPGGVYFYHISAEGDQERREGSGRFVVVR